MFTDILGYTALMQKDEPKARQLIERHREIMAPLIEQHRGEVLQYIGDGTFCTFGSAIDAVNCAIEIQRALQHEPEINLRIGIHLGDVVVAAEEIYGDGVNVASRIEPLAAPGGVCISEKIYDEVKNQPGVETISLGHKKLKNVERPLEVFALAGEGLALPQPEQVAKPPAEPKPEPTEYPRRRKPTATRAAIAAASLLILWGVYRYFAGNGQAPIAIAEENSLAVVYFENLADPEDSQRHAQMVKELLTTDLSQAQALRVISSQRLYDIAKQKRRGEGKVIDRSNATAVAREAGA